MTPATYISFCQTIGGKWRGITEKETALKILHEELDKMSRSECEELIWFFQGFRNLDMAIAVSDYLTARKIHPTHSKTTSYPSIENLMFENGWNGKILEKESSSIP